MHDICHLARNREQELRPDWLTLAALARCTDLGSGASRPFTPDPCTTLATLLLTAEAADDTVSAAYRLQLGISVHLLSALCHHDAFQTHRWCGVMLPQVLQGARCARQYACLAAYAEARCRPECTGRQVEVHLLQGGRRLRHLGRGRLLYRLCWSGG